MIILKNTGIIVEYNPFHYGHLHHIQKTRELTQPDCLIAVMSGNFVQRGEMAIANKWQRAKTAIQYGCDLVVELPFVFATQSAAMFAKGAIDILQLLAVSDIVFGSESNNLQALQKLIHIENDIHEQGLSNSKQFAMIHGNLKPNDILAINYLKELEGRNICAHTIQRTNDYYEQHLHHNIASATAIRHHFLLDEDVSSFTPLTSLNKQTTWHDYYPLLQMIVVTLPSMDLKQIFLVDEGMENLFKKHIHLPTFHLFLEACASKRYTYSRIQRACLQILMHNTKQDIDTLPIINYIRPLAFNDIGKNCLHQCSNNMIAGKFQQIPKLYRDIEWKANILYQYPFSAKDYSLELQPPIYVK